MKKEQSAPVAVRIILVGTTHPGNIGAAARAMKTMCQRQLTLVQPAVFPAAEATARAAGADDILSTTVVCDSLAEAVQDCTCVFATSSRSRRFSLPCLSLDELNTELAAMPARARSAIVFGCEQSGLSNAELDHCNKLICIDTDSAYRSLNVAAAVQVVCYELMRGAAQQTKTVSENAIDTYHNDIATHRQMSNLYRHLNAVLTTIGYLDPDKPKHLLRRLHRLFNRAQLDNTEIKILRGFFTAVQKYCENRDQSRSN